MSPDADELRNKAEGERVCGEDAKSEHETRAEKYDEAAEDAERSKEKESEAEE